ncbi:MAG: hypothetical protein QGG25_13105 [Phycisphaerae bacterium]|jgi:hypothetical protein|nr:hypothetical protein [Phycisphaerae bacterium]
MGLLVLSIFFKIAAAAVGVGLIVGGIGSLRDGEFLLTDNKWMTVRREQRPVRFWTGVIAAFAAAGWVWYYAIVIPIGG